MLFGTLFNDIEITRIKEDGSEYHTIKVPISYSPKDKVLARLDQDPDLDRKYAVLLPRMAFELTTLNYAPERKLTSTTKNRMQDPNSNNNSRYQYVPVPYDLSFTLYIMTKTIDDGTRIIEQILPFFTPELTSTVELVPDMNIKMDIPVILMDTIVQDEYEGSFEERRTITWTLNFVMKGYFFGPIKTSKVITLANTNFYDSSSFGDIEDSIGVVTPLTTVGITPGQLANGSPTSNAALTIDRNSINANSTYGYIITRT